MVDLQESPAVPPFEGEGDERVGWLASGALLIAIGWGAAVALNVYLHVTAPSGGTSLGPLRIFHSMGPFAWITLALGVFTGLVGAGLVWLGAHSPKGRVVLPGYPYPDETGT